MSKLSELVKAHQNSLPITLRAERWWINNPDPVFSEEALQFNDAHLRGKVGGKREDREPSFRASGMGKCPRMRVFARIGAVGISEQYTSAQANIFATGNDIHRKWQRMGLTEGWLVQAEVPYYSKELDLGGTADGVIYDGSLLEIKSINNNGYRWINQIKKARDDHELQMTAYHLLDPNMFAGSAIYENKDTGDWREIRVQFTPQLVDTVSKELEELRESMAQHVLPPIKDKCLTREGTEYRQCPFREVCLDKRTKEWPRGA